MSRQLDEAKVQFANALLEARAEAGGVDTSALHPNTVALVQVSATLAVAEEVQGLRAALLEALGDDSHLNGLRDAVRQASDAIDHIGGTR